MRARAKGHMDNIQDLAELEDRTFRAIQELESKKAEAEWEVRGLLSLLKTSKAWKVQAKSWREYCVGRLIRKPSSVDLDIRLCDSFGAIIKASNGMGLVIDRLRKIMPLNLSPEQEAKLIEFCYSNIEHDAFVSAYHAATGNIEASECQHIGKPQALYHKCTCGHMRKVD